MLSVTTHQSLPNIGITMFTTAYTHTSHYEVVANINSHTHNTSVFSPKCPHNYPQGSNIFVTESYTRYGDTLTLPGYSVKLRKLKVKERK